MSKNYGLKVSQSNGIKERRLTGPRQPPIIMESWEVMGTLTAKILLFQKIFLVNWSAKTKSLLQMF